MSYLNFPRIIFTGDFLADVSTVNNDPTHYDNDNFKSSYQLPGTNDDMNGWWNPEGGANFEFRNCTIIKASKITEGKVEDNEELKGFIVTNPTGRSAGKMVDLDPQEQMVSELWAVKLFIQDKEGNTLLEGDIETTSFRDLQMRQFIKDKFNDNGQPRSGSWTSVVKNIIWKPEIENEILDELKNISELNDNTLAVNLTGFGYHYVHTDDGRFSLGCMIGAIAPWYKNEPKRLFAQRRLYGLITTNGSVMMQYTNFHYDTHNQLLSIDLANSIPLKDKLGAIDLRLFSENKFIIGLSNKQLSTQPGPSHIYGEDFIEIETINLTEDFLKITGGILDISLTEKFNNHFSPEKLQSQQIVLLIKEGNDHTYRLLARESMDGIYINAEYRVVRLDNGDTKKVSIYGNKYGEPLNLENLQVNLDVKKTESISSPYLAICHPSEGLTLTEPKWDENSNCSNFEIQGNAINSPRKYIDGQIYQVNYQLPDYFDPIIAHNYIAVHLRDDFPIPNKPRWQDIKFTLQQYSNLYPIMSKYIVDLGDRESVLARRDILHFSFSQDISSPIYMPVTRDLSEAKRQAILRWLETAEPNDENDM